ncbi:MAG: hypothetical protein PVJ98_02005 [Akkermansiaceae bacterium]
MKRKHFILPTALAFLCGAAANLPGQVLLSYDSGIATTDLIGAADPVAQGWSYTGTGGAFSDGFDAGTGVGSNFGGGWRTVDGTSGAQSVYTIDTSAIIGAITSADGWKMTWTVAVDRDAVRGDGGAEVADYYNSPNNGRQNALLLYFDMDDVNSFRVDHRVNASDVVELLVGGNSYDTGIGLDEFGTYSITYNTASGSAELDYGAGVATITPSIADPNRSTLFMGSGSTGGQGSGVWNSVVIETVTLGGATPPSVIVTPGSANGAFAANLTGEVTDSGNEAPAVTLYYGTSDGGTNPAAWDAFTDAGPQGGTFSTLVESLESSTTYFYRAFAENSAGGAWSPTTASVSTEGVTAPVVVVTDGTANSPGTATFNGEVTDTGNDAPEVTLYFGTSDGETNPGAWDGFLFVGNESGAFSQVVEQLEGGTTYFYRAFVENSAGAAWSPETASVTTPPFTGVPVTLASTSFDYQYEMDVNPSTQDLDLAGSANDWFATSAAATGVDRTLVIPQTYAGGLATSNQLAAVPEALFRTDFTGSILRESIVGDFTIEVAVRLVEGSIAVPGFDLGGFGVFLNPNGQDALRLNINESDLSTGTGNEVVATGSNTDTLHVYRIAFVESDQRYWVWRDGVLVYGNNTDAGGGIAGSEASIYTGGGFLLGDFAADLSGDWEVDYIRLHNEAVAPDASEFARDLRVTRSGFANANTFFIEFEGTPLADYQVTSSTTLDGFGVTEFPANGTTGATDENGVGRVEIDVSGRIPGKLFFRLEEQP